MGWLTGWKHRLAIIYAGATGGTTNYVVFVKAYAGAGTSGTEALAGGHKGVTAAKVYLPTETTATFVDVNFTAADGTTRLDFFKDTYTASTSALFAVEVAASLAVGQLFYVYWGGGDGTNRSSSATTFRRVISSGVVLALPMNEGVGTTCEDYSGNGADGALGAGVASPTWVTTGKYGTALSFDGGDTITVKAFDELNTFTNLHFAVYFKLSDFTGTSKCVFIRTAWYNLYDGAVADNDDIYQLAYFKNTGDALDFMMNTVLAPAVLGTQYSGVMSIEASGANIVLSTRINGALVRTQSDNDFKDFTQGNIATNFVVGSKFRGVIGGLYILNSSLTTDEKDEFNSYYPQCSSANLGTLYLRSYVNPEPQPSSFGDYEVPTEPTGEIPQREPHGPPAPRPSVPNKFMLLIRDWLEAKTKARENS